MAETWSVEAEAYAHCGCGRRREDPNSMSVTPHCRCAFFAKGIRAGLTRAAVICETRAQELLKQKLDFDADACERCARAIQEQAK